MTGTTNRRISRSALNIALALGATDGIIFALLLASSGLEILLGLPIGSYSYQVGILFGVALLIAAGTVLAGITHILVEKWAGDA